MLLHDYFKIISFYCALEDLTQLSEKKIYYNKLSIGSVDSYIF